jgi:RNA polymerase sigma-70 factor (ECF subfamily)
VGHVRESFMTLSIPAWWFGSHSDENGKRHDVASGDRHAVSRPSTISAMADPDAPLLARIRGTHVVEAQAAFETLFCAYYDMLTKAAYTIVRSSDIARDVVAEVFTTLWFMRTQWDPAISARAYLIAAVRRRALNSTRNERRHQASLQSNVEVPAHPELSLVHGIDDERRLAHVYAAIARMHGIRRDVMTLRWRHALSVPEIASALGISTNSVSAHLSQALRILKETLGTGQTPPQR